MLKKIMTTVTAMLIMLSTGITVYENEPDIYEDEPNTYEDKPDTSDTIDTFIWRRVPVAEFPYYTILHSHEVGITVDGMDIINGESVPGAVYKDGRPWLDGLDTDGDIYINDEYIFYITLSGDSRIRTLIFNGTSLCIEGDGTLTAESIQPANSIYYEAARTYEPSMTLTVRENASVIGTDTPETASELNRQIKVNDIAVKDNGHLKCDDIAGKQICLYDNASVAAEHCSVDEIILADDSVMEVRGDYGKYPGLDITDDLKSCIYKITNMEIRDNARLSAECNTTDYGIFCRSTGTDAQITISGSGILDVSGSSGFGISAEKNYYSMIGMHDDSQVIINGFKVGLATRRLEINGGTLKINSDGDALQINPKALNYKRFGTGIYINGDAVSQSCDWLLDTSEDDNSFIALRSSQTGSKLKDLSITVKEKQQ